MKRLPRIHKTLAALTVVFAAAISGCSSSTEAGSNQGSDGLATSAGEHDLDGGEHGREGRGEQGHDERGEHAREGRGEHDRDSREHGGEGRGEHDRDGDGHHGEEGEESGTELSLTERYDKVRNGARLILAYDAKSNSFKGTVENTTKRTLERVRVEVHLSNGKELGPTTPADLKPGKKREVKLTATTRDFDAWTAHPEVGNEEHGHGEGHGEGGGEHGRGQRGDFKPQTEREAVLYRIILKLQRDIRALRRELDARRSKDGPGQRGEHGRGELQRGEDGRSERGEPQRGEHGHGQRTEHGGEGRSEHGEEHKEEGSD